MRKLIEKNEWVVITSIFMLVTIALFQLASLINGPYVFADESEYHWLASEIYHFQKFYGHQYNPLYPLFIAPTFYFNDFATQIFAIKLFNIAVYVSIIFPAYLIGREILISKPQAVLLAFVASLAPIGAYSHMVWADPLYYTLICWSYYFFVRYLIHEKRIDIFLVGVFIGFAYLAKQAGLFFLISIYVYAAYAAFSGIKKFDRKAIGLLTLGAALIILPWIIKNTFFAENGLGYSSMFSTVFETLRKAPLQYVEMFLGTIAYSVGYWVFIYSGAGIFLLLSAAFRSDRRDGNESRVVGTLAKIVLIHTLLLMLVSEFLFIPYIKFPVCTGRYVDVIYPIAIILIAWVLLKQERFSRRFILRAAVACFVLLLLFSPLTQVWAFAVTTNSGVSLLNIFWWPGFNWEVPNLTLLNKLALAVVLTGLLVAVLVLRKNAIWIICVYSLLLGVGAHLQGKRLGEMSNPSNQLFLELNKRHIPISDIAFDNAIKDDGTQFRLRFWYPSDPSNFAPSKFVDPIKLVGKVSIDFGHQVGKTGNGVMKIWAPWNPESGFNETYASGFSDITTLNAAKCPDLPKQGDFIFDHKPLEFKFNLPAGSYTLRGKSADTRCLGVESEFVVQVQDGGSVKLDRNAEFVLPFEVSNEGRGLKMTMKPADGKVWAFDEISIEQLQNKELSQTGKFEYLVSKRLLPLPQILNVFDYRLYKIQDGY